MRRGEYPEAGDGHDGERQQTPDDRMNTFFIPSPPFCIHDRFFSLPSTLHAVQDVGDKTVGQTDDQRGGFLSIILDPHAPLRPCPGISLTPNRTVRATNRTRWRPQFSSRRMPAPLYPRQIRATGRTFQRELDHHFLLRRSSRSTFRRTRRPVTKTSSPLPLRLNLSHL